MKRMVALMAALLMILLSATALAHDGTGTVGEEQAAGRLEGMLIGLDPGHQSHANRDLEPISPGSDDACTRATMFVEPSFGSRTSAARASIFPPQEIS